MEIKKHKYLMFFTRIIILIVITLIILYIFEYICYSKNYDKSNQWTWTNENSLINNMLLHKYPSNSDENFPLAINKDSEIKKKEPDEKRILVVGDSFVWGFGGTNINYLWWKQLEKKLKEEGYKNVNIYAAGYWGFNTMDEYNKIISNKNLIDKIDPDLIVIGYVFNDPEKRDANNRNIILDASYENNTILYKKFPNLYAEVRNKITNFTDNYKMLKFLGKYFSYRYDVRARVITEKENTKQFEQAVKKIDNKLTKLNIPYFYYFNTIHENENIKIANQTIYNLFKKNNINVYYKPLPNNILKYGDRLTVNPGDSHPGIILNNYYANEVYKILKDNYNYLLDYDSNYNIENEALEINDSMPYLDIKKISSNKYEFTYPISQNNKNMYYNFLYFPLKNDYIKLNLRFPKNVSKIKISGDDLKKVKLYVNTIDKKTGIDMNESLQLLTHCDYIGNNTYKVNDRITSVNISANFKKNSNRKLIIEFIEEEE